MNYLIDICKNVILVNVCINLVFKHKLKFKKVLSKKLQKLISSVLELLKLTISTVFTLLDEQFFFFNHFYDFKNEI